MERLELVRNTNLRVAEELKNNRLDRALEIAVNLEKIDLANYIGEVIYSPDDEYEEVRDSLIQQLTEE